MPNETEFGEKAKESQQVGDNHPLAYDNADTFNEQADKQDFQIGLQLQIYAGVLVKYVNFGKGWRHRLFILQDGVLRYYKARSSLATLICIIQDPLTVLHSHPGPMLSSQGCYCASKAFVVSQRGITDPTGVRPISSRCVCVA